MLVCLHALVRMNVTTRPYTSAVMCSHCDPPRNLRLAFMPHTSQRQSRDAAPQQEEGITGGEGDGGIVMPREEGASWKLLQGF